MARPRAPISAWSPGTFLFVKFNSLQVLDLGINNSSTLNLAAGANVFGYTAFPDGYSAWQLLRQLGPGNVLLRADAGCPVGPLAGGGILGTGV